MIEEAFRVLKPGGRFAVSDVVVRGEVPPAVRKSMEQWVGCIAGALEEKDYGSRLARAGFDSIHDRGNFWPAKASTWIRLRRSSRTSS